MSGPCRPDLSKSLTYELNRLVGFKQTDKEAPRCQLFRLPLSRAKRRKREEEEREIGS